VTRVITFNSGWRLLQQDLTHAIQHSGDWKKEFATILSDALLQLVKSITPVDSGELEESWKIRSATIHRIIIGSDNPETVSRIISGIRAQTIVSKNGKAMHFFMNGEEFFRSKVETKGVRPDNFLETLVQKRVNRLIRSLATVLVIENNRMLKGRMKGGKRFNKKYISSNLSKTTGLTDTRRNNRRGRGGGIQKAKTGRKSFRRVLSRRRRTGTYITSKKVKVQQ